MSRCCVANLTHMLLKSSSNEMHVLVASNNISLSCLEGRIYIITLLIHCHQYSLFYKSITSSRYVEDTSGYTLVHTLVHDKYLPACWVSRKLKPKSKTIPCYTADCFKSSCLRIASSRLVYSSLILCPK